MMRSFEERLDEVEVMIKKPSFRQNKGLGNEVGYYIFDYPPEKEMQVRERIRYLHDKYESSLDGFRVVVYDLYDLMINMLEEYDLIEDAEALEKKRGLDSVVKAVNDALMITSRDSVIVKTIKENTPDNSVIFLTGIGKCYPLIRSHTVLNNLHQVVDNVPVVMFFPGKYDGQELVLFGEIKDDNYYRAFKLVD